MPSQCQEQTSLWPWRGKQPEFFTMPEELFCPPLDPTKHQAPFVICCRSFDLTQEKHISPIQTTPTCLRHKSNGQTVVMSLQNPRCSPMAVSIICWLSLQLLAISRSKWIRSERSTHCQDMSIAISKLLLWSEEQASSRWQRGPTRPAIDFKTSGIR